MRFTIFQESRKGSRKVNQDRIAYTYGRDTLLMVVADGMGGHAGGEIAAQIAVRLFVERFQQEAKPVLRNPLKFLQDTMLRAHSALGSYANQFSMLETPRTTCVACVVQANHAYWAHVGDSRFYLFRQGALIGSTKDHSKVQYLVDQGLIGAHEVADHPERNKVFSCLGGLVEPVIDLSKRTPLRNGDVLLLCTDGVWGVLTQGEIANYLTSTPILKTGPQMMREADHRPLGAGDAHRRAVVDHHRDDGARRVRHRDRPHRHAHRPQGNAARPDRRRDRARDRRDPGDDPQVPALTSSLARVSHRAAAGGRGARAAR
ncbi:MAG: serine/threonine-protein phosphatase [Burkholderiales bacterium]|nr:serine/threonine-protein phosphatase [Burkholderiales bacterium]